MSDSSTNEGIYLDVLEYRGNASDLFSTSKPIKNFLKVITVSKASYDTLMRKDPGLAVFNSGTDDILVYSNKGCEIPVGAHILFELVPSVDPKRHYNLIYHPPKRTVVNFKRVKSSSTTFTRVDGDSTERRDRYSPSPSSTSTHRDLSPRKTDASMLFEQLEKEADKTFRREQAKRLVDEIKTQILDLNIKADTLKMLLDMQ